METITSYPLIFRARDVEVRRSQLREDLQAGHLKNPWRGIYTRADAPLTGQRMAAFALRRPDAVFGLWTALYYHDLTDRHPRRVEAFIPRTTPPPRFNDIPHSVVQQKPEWLEIGVEPRNILGVETRTTTIARTVVDAFRFSRQIANHYAVSALREYLETGRPLIDLTTLAHTFNVYQTMQPYLRALR